MRDCGNLYELSKPVSRADSIYVFGRKQLSSSGFGVLQTGFGGRNGGCDNKLGQITCFLNNPEMVCDISMSTGKMLELTASRLEIIDPRHWVGG